MKTITREQYLQLYGIVTLAKSYYEKIDDLVKTAAEIVGEKEDGYNYYGHVSDTIWNGDTNVDYLLKKLGISIIIFNDREEFIDFGVKKDYKEGDIVVWRGHNPGIFRIKERSTDFMYLENCFETTLASSHNSLHISNLRPATKDEIKQLGNQEYLFYE